MFGTSYLSTFFLLSHIVEENEGEALPAVRVLVQHLCMKVPDQAEFRNSVGKVMLLYSRLSCVEIEVYHVQYALS
jgi:hypothetical protein